MKPFNILYMVAYLYLAFGGSPIQGNKHSFSDHLKSSSSNEISLEKLEKLSLEKGAELIQKWYHDSKLNYKLLSDFVPSPHDIPVYIIKSHDKKEITDLNSFVKVAQEDPSFGDTEVSIFITGLPSTIESVKKANSKLIHAYIERYNHKQETSEHYKKYSSSEDTSIDESHQNLISGNLIVIDLGVIIDNLEHLAMLNIYETGAIIGKALVQLTNECDLPQELIHVVAQGVAAHVAGAAGDEYTHLTGHKLRRITALDPSKPLIKNADKLIGLARGDADFVDAIHTSVYGMGTLTRVGDIDFFPSGLCVGVVGTDNVIEASMRATLFFAESLLPGNERNFPAIEANSLKQYKSDNGFGRRAFMGIDAAYDLRGDYMLDVNEKSPFGTRSFAPETWHQHKQ